MKYFIFVTVLLLSTLFIGFKQSQAPCPVSSPSYEYSEETNEIRKNLELVTLGLMTLSADPVFTALVTEMAVENQSIRTIDLTNSFDSESKSLVEMVFNNVMKFTEDKENAQRVADSFCSFKVNGKQYFPTVIPLGIINPTTNKMEFPNQSDYLPDYIVNQARPERDLFYGYLADGRRTYMRSEDLVTINGWLVHETTNEKDINSILEMRKELAHNN